jgi:RHS repeat-associated protein
VCAVSANAQTNGYGISVNSGSTTNLTFDLNGNMTSDGTNSYAWDCENRLVEIDYVGSGNKTVFSINPLGGRAKIQEYSGGSVTSTKQFCGPEERNGSGSVTKQFFSRGELVSGSPYFYSLDHLGSVRELTDLSGNKQAEYSFDPYGVKTTLLEAVVTDYQYSGYYLHSRSGLSLTATRAYNPQFGRFINRDPIAEQGGVNLYGYVGNAPIAMSDPTVAVLFRLAPLVGISFLFTATRDGQPVMVRYQEMVALAASVTTPALARLVRAQMLLRSLQNSSITTMH